MEQVYTTMWKVLIYDTQVRKMLDHIQVQLQQFIINLKISNNIEGAKKLKQDITHDENCSLNNGRKRENFEDPQDTPDNITYRDWVIIIGNFDSRIVNTTITEIIRIQ